MKIEVELNWVAEDRPLDEAIFHGVVEAIQERINDKVRERIKAEVDRAVSRAVNEAIPRLIDPEIQRVIAEGWHRTNEWGEPLGTEPVRLPVLIREYLDTKSRNYHATKRIDEILREAVDQTLKSDLKAEVEGLRKRFNEQVDAVLQAKLVETLRRSLGLG